MMQEHHFSSKEFQLSNVANMHSREKRGATLSFFSNSNQALTQKLI
jgi:hypothetical protein